MEENEHIPPLPQILHLPDPNKGSLSPATLLKYLRFLTGLCKDVPDLYLPSNQDRELFLLDAERVKLETCESEIKDWLEKSEKNNNIGLFGIHTCSTPFDAISDLKKLLKKVVECKADKEKRLTVLRAINPPVEDAKKYLTAKEQQQFIESLPGAVDAYLSTKKEKMKYLPDIWLANVQALDYCYWISNIEKRRNKEASQEKAQIEYDRYIDKLSIAVEKLKKKLALNKKPAFNYPHWLNKYEPGLWGNSPLPTNPWFHDWAEKQIANSLPQVLIDVTRCDIDWQVRVFPEAVYELVDGIPCLMWYFETQVLVTADLELKECHVKKYYEPGYTVIEPAKGEKLGTTYLGPIEWDTSSSFTTPIALLTLLSTEDLELPGITVIDHGFQHTTYAVQGFEEEVVVYDSFRKFIKDITVNLSLADALLSKGLIDEVTAKLVEEKTALPLPLLTGTGQTSSDDRDVIAELEVLGYNNEEIMEAMEEVPLSPIIPLKEKVAAVLGILNMNSP